MDYGPSSRRSSRSGRARALSFSLVSVSLIGVFSSLIPVANATHDTNDFFALEASFPNVDWNDIHGISSLHIYAIGSTNSPIEDAVSVIATRRTGTWQLETHPTMIQGNGVFVDTSVRVHAVGSTCSFSLAGDIACEPILGAGAQARFYDGASWQISSIIGAHSSFNTVTGKRSGAISTILVGGFDGGTSPQGVSWFTTVTTGDPRFQRTTAQCTDPGTDAVFGIGAFQTLGDYWLALNTGPLFRVTNNVCVTKATTFINDLSGSSADEMVAIGTNGVIYRQSAGTFQTVASGTLQNLNDVTAVTISDSWIVGNAGTILHSSGGDYTPEPTVTGSRLDGVTCVSATECWIVSDSGDIFRLQSNVPVALPSLTGFTFDPDNLMITASQAQCLGDEVSFTINTEPPVVGGNIMEAYIIDSDDNVVEELVSAGAFYSLQARYFYTSRFYPAGDYNFLVKIDNGIGVSDPFAGVAFNVPTNTCFGAEGIQEAIDEHNSEMHLDHDEIIENINNANSTAAGGILSLGALPGLTISETTLFILALGLLIFALWRGWWMVGGVCTIGILVAISNEVEEVLNVNGWILFLLIAYWLELLVEKRRSRLNQASADTNDVVQGSV